MESILTLLWPVLQIPCTLKPRNPARFVAFGLVPRGRLWAGLGEGQGAADEGLCYCWRDREWFRGYLGDLGRFPLQDSKAS